MQKRVAPLVPHGMGGAFIFSLLLHRRRNKTTLKWFGALENLFVHYIICILRL